MTVRNLHSLRTKDNGRARLCYLDFITAKFERLMEAVLRGAFEQYPERAKKLKMTNLKTNPSKLKLFLREVSYLGSYQLR